MLLQVRVNLWDLAGPSEYLEVRNEFYKDSQAALLVYDVTNRQSFEALGTWLEESQKFGAPSNMVSFAWCNSTYSNTDSPSASHGLRLLHTASKDQLQYALLQLPVP